MLIPVVSAVLFGALTATAVFASPTPVQPAPSPIFLSSVSQTNDNPRPGETNVITVGLGSKTVPQRVLVDLELKDATGKTISQRYWPSVTIPKKGSLLRQITAAANLPDGQYSLSVGIFQPKWARLVQWYDHAADFTVGPQPVGQLTLYDLALPSGAGGEVTATLISGNSATQKALVSLYLTDSSGKRVAEKIYEAQTLPTGQPQRFALPTGDLSPGSYRFSLQVYDSMDRLVFDLRDVRTFTLS